jgi:hypothetical protein
MNLPENLETALRMVLWSIISAAILLVVIVFLLLFISHNLDMPAEVVGSNVFTVLGMGGIISFVIGLILRSSATPVEDRRYKTGYKNNATVDYDAIRWAEILQTTGVCLIVFKVISWGSFFAASSALVLTVLGLGVYYSGALQSSSPAAGGAISTGEKEIDAQRIE